MKHKRQKYAQKQMTFYEKHFGLTSPYNVLVDGTYVREALMHKAHVGEQLPRYLGGEVRLYTTTCVLRELEALGSLLYGCLKIMREYKVAPCPHVQFGVDPVDCLRKVAKRSHPDHLGQETEEEQQKKGTELRFIVATQHTTLSEKLRKIPGLPILYQHGNACILEKSSDASLEAAGTIRRKRLVPEHEQKSLEKLLEQEGIALEEDGPIHWKKKLKGPNPLSVLSKRGGMTQTKREKINERKRWRNVRKRMGRKMTPLQELMVRELLTEDKLGWKGIIYQRKTIAELEEELGIQHSEIAQSSEDE